MAAGAHWIFLNARAALYGIGYTAKRHPIATLLAGAVLIFFATYQPPPAPVETAEQHKARLENEIRQAQLQAKRAAEEEEKRAAEASRVRSLCSMKPICEKYAKIRQDCAVAGDFSNCMKIRMGEDAGSTMYCRTDGSIITSFNVPNTADCWLSEVNHWLGGR